MNIYVGNLAFGVKEPDLQAAFAAFGTVESVKIMTDKHTGESRGFAFVEMPVEAEARAAIQGNNGKDLMGRALNVSEARPREDRGTGGGRPGGGRPGGGFGGGRPGGGFGGGGNRSGGGGGGGRRW